MATFTKIFILKTDILTLDLLENFLPNIKINEDTNYFYIHISEDDVDFHDVYERMIYAVSEKLNCEVIWLFSQTTIGAVSYIHVKDGLLKRKLLWGCIEAHQWNVIEGEPEQWENDYSDKTFKLGEFYPVLSASFLSQYYNLPYKY